MISRGGFFPVIIDINTVAVTFGCYHLLRMGSYLGLIRIPDLGKSSVRSVR